MSTASALKLDVLLAPPTTDAPQMADCICGEPVADHPRQEECSTCAECGEYAGRTPSGELAVYCEECANVDHALEQQI